MKGIPERFEVTLTEGNIRNDHIYLASAISHFPDDVVGGPNQRESASREIEIHYGAGAPVLSDIAGDKKVFRKRSWAGDFIREHDLVAGDAVVIEFTGPYRVHIYPKR